MTAREAFEKAGFPAPAGTGIYCSHDCQIWLAVDGKKQYFFSHREDTLGWQPRGFIQDQVCLDAKFRNVGGDPVGPLVLPEAVRKGLG